MALYFRHVEASQWKENEIFWWVTSTDAVSRITSEFCPKCFLGTPRSVLGAQKNKMIWEWHVERKADYIYSCMYEQLLCSMAVHSMTSSYVLITHLQFYYDIVNFLGSKLGEKLILEHHYWSVLLYFAEEGWDCAFSAFLSLILSGNLGVRVGPYFVLEGHYLGRPQLSNILKHVPNFKHVRSSNYFSKTIHVLGHVFKYIAESVPECVVSFKLPRLCRTSLNSILTLRGN